MTPCLSRTTAKTMHKYKLEKWNWRGVKKVETVVSDDVVIEVKRLTL